jgi:hypothetical protein
MYCISATGKSQCLAHSYCHGKAQFHKSDNGQKPVRTEIKMATIYQGKSGYQLKKIWNIVVVIFLWIFSNKQHFYHLTPSQEPNFFGKLGFLSFTISCILKSELKSINMCSVCMSNGNKPFDNNKPSLQQKSFKQ